MREQFFDPTFDPLSPEIERIIGVAWNGYDQGRKAPRTQKAGPGYADPDYDLAVESIEASRRIKDAERRQKDAAAPSRILLINGAARSEHTCPGESSKSWRLAASWFWHWGCSAPRKKRLPSWLELAGSTSKSWRRAP